MVEEVRTALGIGQTVPTSKGPVEVRTLSAVQFIGLTDQLVSIGKMIVAEANGGDQETATIRLITKQPTIITGLMSSSTSLTAENLGDLPVDEFLDLTLAFVEQHEKAISRFFALKKRWDQITVRVNAKPSPSSSTVSSPSDGPTVTSEN